MDKKNTENTKKAETSVSGSSKLVKKAKKPVIGNSPKSVNGTSSNTAVLIRPEFWTGDPSSLRESVQALLSAMDATDLSWSHGMTECSLKHLVFTLLTMSAPKGVTVQSERKIGGTFADIVTGDRIHIIIELKAIPLEFVSLTRLRQPISTRDELAAMKSWLLGLQETDVKEKLLISTHTMKQVITPTTHLNDAFQQAVGYATGLLREQEDDDDEKTVIAIALLAIGPLVLTKAARVML